MLKCNSLFHLQCHFSQVLIFPCRMPAFGTRAASGTDRENVKFFIDSVRSTFKLVSTSRTA